MRIVAGRLGGRILAAPKDRAIRPTSDRLRETLFNILFHVYGDPISSARVLDLFAGTGALGLEAMSRGAAFALFVDDGVAAKNTRDPAQAQRFHIGTNEPTRRDPIVDE